MLVLSRKVGEQIVLPKCDVTVEVLSVSGQRVRIGVTANSDVPVHRMETWRRICQSGQTQSTSGEERCPRIRVLIAEEDRNVAASCRDLLSGCGFESHIAGDGLECVSRLRDAHFDVLLLGRNLLWGGVAGVLAVMSEDSTISVLPVLVHAHASDSDVVFATKLPVVDRITEPLDAPGLTQRVRDLVQRFQQHARRKLLHGVSAEFAEHLAHQIDEHTGGRVRVLVLRVEEGTLFVHGFAPSYHARQLAEVALMQVLKESGLSLVEDVVFNVEVAAPFRRFEATVDSA